jgi:glycosyltransferase involved in cell wall biosynthesis
MRRLVSRAERILAPSEAAASLYQHAWPDLQIAVVPHPERAFDPLTVSGGAQDKRTVVIIGTLGEHKGVTVVESCVRDAKERKLPLKFVVVGEMKSQLESPHLAVLGRFSPPQLPSILADLRAEIGFLPSIWPETYSYVLSEYYRNGLYPVVFDIGAQGERVRASGHGTVLAVNIGAPAINDTLLNIKPELTLGRPHVGPLEEDYVDLCYGTLFAVRNDGRAL